MKTVVHPLIAISIFHYEFEFIHPSVDGFAHMGRLWQSLILSRWNFLSVDIPVESIVFAHQPEYYQALQDGARQTDCAPFITFIRNDSFRTQERQTPFSRSQHELRTCDTALILGIGDVWGHFVTAENFTWS